MIKWLFFFTILFLFTGCGLVKKITKRTLIEKPVIIEKLIRDSTVIIVPPKVIKETISVEKLLKDTIIIKENDDLILEFKLDSVRNKIYAECRQANKTITFKERVVEKPVVVTKKEVITEECDCPSLFWYTVKIIAYTVLTIGVLAIAVRFLRPFLGGVI